MGIKHVLGERVLFLGAHLDDVEFGCGGILQRCIAEEGVAVRIDTASDHNENAKNEIQLFRDVSETVNAMRILGVTNYNIHRIPGQRFDTYNQEIRELLLSIKKEYNPTSVFFPALLDIHQDHEVIANESYRIFRNVNCFGYEVIRSSREFEPNVSLEVSEEELINKIDAIMSYASQINQSAAYYFDKDIIRAISIFRGAKIGVKFAESFCCYQLRI